MDGLELLTNPYPPPANTMSDPSHQPVHPAEPREDAVAEHSLPTPSAPISGEKGTRRASDRLNIPSSIVHAAGFAPGDKAFVADEDPAGAIAKPCLVLLKEQPPKLVADYAVAKGYRIRVTPVILKKCGLEGEAFEIDSSVGKIVVRPRKSWRGAPSLIGQRGCGLCRSPSRLAQSTRTRSASEETE